MPTIDNTIPQHILDSVNTRPTGDLLSGTVEETQDRFLKLLVAQMTNQDPMNPLDNQQVTSQLAQLSTVSGINQLNATVEAFKESVFTSQALQSANMIGHGVFAPGNSLYLYEGVSVFGVDLKEMADSFIVNIFNESGNLVHSLDLGAQQAGVIPIAWDGKVNGEPLPDGKYTFYVNAKAYGESVSAPTLSFGEVVSVTKGDKGVTLNVTGLGEVDFSQVRQIL